MDCIAHEVPLSMEFSRQEYWSVLMEGGRVDGTNLTPAVVALEPYPRGSSSPASLKIRAQNPHWMDVLETHICCLGRKT